MRLASKLLSIMLMFALVMTVQADIQGAMLYSKGMVKVNGMTARATTPILAGDSLETSFDANAQIVAGGSFIQIQPNSSIVYSTGNVVLRDGVAVISSTQNLTAQVNNLTVSPADGKSARFTIRQQDGQVQVGAMVGNVTITGEKQPVVLLEGQVYTQQSASNAKTAGSTPPGVFNFSANAQLIFLVSSAIVAGVTLGIVNSLSPGGP